jgi:hypothetical protein
MLSLVTSFVKNCYPDENVIKHYQLGSTLVSFHLKIPSKRFTRLNRHCVSIYVEY